MLLKLKPPVFFLLFLILFAGFSSLYGQGIKVLMEQDYYTNEKEANVLIYLPPNKVLNSLEFIIFAGGEELTVPTKFQPGLNKIPVSIAHMPVGESILNFSLRQSKASLMEIPLTIVKRKPKYNEVKINHSTGSLIVDGLPYIPYGFYCYSPVQPTLAEEEVVRGFNMMSPYQTIAQKTINDRRNYMDRCASLGMKVHYNLLRVSGGGGVGFRRPDGRSDEEKRKLLIDEINEFKDHPALLAWYISDEPVGHGVKPEPLEEIYNLIKTLDPYHPISIVFMTPSRARKYANAMDIVMADPYPIPTGSVSEVGRITRRLVKEFYLEKPVWIVPQAFGGNEWWAREPTSAEIRSMTYQSLIQGARGIQYFVRHGRNGFPKSMVAWNECSNIAHEVAELSPDLTLGTPVNNISTNNKDIQIQAVRYNNKLSIIVVNIKNKPVKIRVDLKKNYPSKKAEVLFENRKIDIRGNIIDDFVDGFGTRVYRIDLLTELTDADLFHEENLVVNPGFEEIYSPGVPSATYARIRGDRGSTYFVDSRTSYEGNQSVRLITPDDNRGIGLSFFPLSLKGGNSYTISVWAKARPADPYWEPFEPNVIKRLFQRSVLPDTMPDFTMGLRGFDLASFQLTPNWKKYSTSTYIGDLSLESPRINPYLELTTRGTAWFDKLEVFPDLTTETKIVNDVIEVSIKNINGEGEIHYTLDGFEPVYESDIYSGPIVVAKSSLLRASLFKDSQPLGRLTKAIAIHDALGKKVSIKNSYSSRYTAGGKSALTDGLVASRFYGDGLWQGYSGRDMHAVIDLKKEITIDQVSVTFLQNLERDIFLPYKVRFEVSNDGKKFTEIYSFSDSRPKRHPGPFRAVFGNSFKDISARYVRVIAYSYGTVPDWLPDSTGNAWLFVDEILVNKK